MQGKLYTKPKMDVTIFDKEVFLATSFDGFDNTTQPGQNWGGTLPDPSNREWTGWY